MNENKKILDGHLPRDPTTTILAPWLSATPCSMYGEKKTSKSHSLPELDLFQKFTIPLENLQSMDPRIARRHCEPVYLRAPARSHAFDRKDFQFSDELSPGTVGLFFIRFSRVKYRLNDLSFT